MESGEGKHNTSILNIISLQNCRSSDTESDKNKLNPKFKHASSFDSENFKDSSLEVSDFSDEKLKDNKKRTTSISFNDEEQYLASTFLQFIMSGLIHKKNTAFVLILENIGMKNY